MKFLKKGKNTLTGASGLWDELSQIADCFVCKETYPDTVRTEGKANCPRGQKKNGGTYNQIGGYSEGGHKLPHAANLPGARYQYGKAAHGERGKKRTAGGMHRRGGTRRSSCRCSWRSNRSERAAPDPFPAGRVRGDGDANTHGSRNSGLIPIRGKPIGCTWTPPSGVPVTGPAWKPTVELHWLMT